MSEATPVAFTVALFVLVFAVVPAGLIYVNATKHRLDSARLWAAMMFLGSCAAIASVVNGMLPALGIPVCIGFLYYYTTDTSDSSSRPSDDDNPNYDHKHTWDR